MSRRGEIKLRRDMATTHSLLWFALTILSWPPTVEPFHRLLVAVSVLQCVLHALVAISGHMALRKNGS